MKKIHNFERTLELIAKDVSKEIRIFYDDPKNKEKFKNWQKNRNNEINSPTGY